MSITWKDIYETGVPVIDDQHKNLIKLINDLYEAQKKGQGQLVIGNILDNLVDYTQKHFTAEEQLFENTAYPQIEDHKKEHAYFTGRINEFKSDQKSGNIILSLKTIDFLKDWTINHILGTDKEYTPYLKL